MNVERGGMNDDGHDAVCQKGVHCCCCSPGEKCCDCGKQIGPSAAEVLRFIDTFAGQENTAEEVRDFVQRAAMFVDEDKPETEWADDPMLAMFAEWAREERAKR